MLAQGHCAALRQGRVWLVGRSERKCVLGVWGRQEAGSTVRVRDQIWGHIGNSGLYPAGGSTDFMLLSL